MARTFAGCRSAMRKASLAAAVGKARGWHPPCAIRARRDRPGALPPRLLDGNGRHGRQASGECTSQRPVPALDKGREPEAFRLQARPRSVLSRNAKLDQRTPSRTNVCTRRKRTCGPQGGSPGFCPEPTCAAGTLPATAPQCCSRTTRCGRFRRIRGPRISRATLLPRSCPSRGRPFPLRWGGTLPAVR